MDEERMDDERLDEDRRLILSLVEEGKITSEEAAALLQALDELDGEELPPAEPAEPPLAGGDPAAASAGATGAEEPVVKSASSRPPLLDQIPGFDPDQLAHTLEGVMGRVGDELRHLPDQLARLGFGLGERVRANVVARRPWQATAGAISIDNANGDITVSTWDRAEVSLEAELRLTGHLDDAARRWVETEGVRLDEVGGRLRVVTRDPAREIAQGPRLVGADLRLQVPAGAAVRIRAARGDVSLSGDLSGIEVDVASGDVDVNGGSGAVHLSSRSGDVSVEGFNGHSLDLNSASGDLEARGTAASVRLHTLSGDVSVDLAGCREVRAVSVSGDVEGDVRLEAGATCNAQTTSGDVDLRLAASGLKVDLQSLSGDLDCLLPLDQVQRSKRALTGSRGDGAARVNAKSLSGDVTLR